MQNAQEIRQRLTTEGAALGRVWGGPQRQHYYMPSGEEVWAIPSMREWVRRDEKGKVLESGLRDANLDKGWTLSPPAMLKLHCSGCDKYHDTKAEVEVCVKAKAQVAQKWERKAHLKLKAEGNGTGEMDAVNKRLDRLEDLLEKLLEAKG